MNLRIVEDHARLTQVAHDHSADLALVLEAERLLGRGPHFGELVLGGLLGLCQRRQRGQHEGERRQVGMAQDGCEIHVLALTADSAEGSSREPTASRKRSLRAANARRGSA